MAVEVIYESEHLRVLFHEGSSDFALIAFNSAAWITNGLTFWSQPIVEKASITTVGIMTHRSNWYPYEDMMKAIDVINQTLSGFKEIIAYGSSMGGYGTLKYGRALNATCVLSFAPQWSIAPKDVGSWDKRFINEYRPNLNGDMSIRAEDVIDNAFIFYDPFFEPDRLNVERIVGLYPAARLVTAHLTGDLVVQIFAGTAKVLRLFDLARASDLTGLRQETAKNRRNAKDNVRLHSLISLYVKSDPVAAQRIMDRRPEAFDAPGRASVNYQLSTYYVSNNEFEKAAVLAAAAVADAPNVPAYKMRQSIIEGRRGNHSAAIAFAREGFEKWPKHKVVSVRLFEALLTAGDIAAAERHIEVAASLDPGSTTIIHGRLKLAEAKNDQKSRIHWMRQLIELSPTTESYHAYAKFMASIGKYGESSDALRQMVEMNPTNATYWQTLARSYMAEPRNIRAGEAAEQAARLAPDDPKNYELAAAAYRRAGLAEYAVRNEMAYERILAAKALRDPPAEHEPPAPRKPEPARGWRSLFSREQPASKAASPLPSSQGARLLSSGASGAVAT